MKKLTAGIFTALLGLVTVNAANAAIPSTTYVDTKITTAQTAAQNYAVAQDATLKSAIETDYKAADATLDGKITDNANAISEMDTFVAPDVTMTVGNANPTTVTAAINALDARITEKTSGIASEGTVNELTEAVEGLKTTVSGHTTDISGLQTRMTTAEGDIGALEGLVGTTSVAAQIEAANNTQTTELRDYADQAEADALAAAKTYANDLNTTATAAIQANATAIASNDTDITNLQSKDAELADSIATKADATATTNALALKANTADLGALAAKDTVATSDLDSTLQDAVTQVATNKSDIESLSTTVGTKASQADLNTTNSNVTTLTGRVDTAEDDIDALETKTAGLKTLAYQDIIDNSDITDGTIAQAKITNLTTDLAAKVDDSQVIAEAGTVTNADAEIPTIARMNAALDEKMPLTTIADTNIGADGTYVLTATTEAGATTYKWEEISRVAGTN